MKLIEAAAKPSLTNYHNRLRITHGVVYDQGYQTSQPVISKEDIHQAIIDARRAGTLIQFERETYFFNFQGYASLQDLLAVLLESEKDLKDERRYVILPLNLNEDGKVTPSGKQEFWNSVPSLSRPRS